MRDPTKLTDQQLYFAYEDGRISRVKYRGEVLRRTKFQSKSPNSSEACVGTYALNKENTTMATATKAKKPAATKAKKPAAAKAKATKPEVEVATEASAVPTLEASEKLPWLKSEATKWRKVHKRFMSLTARLTKAQDQKHSPDLIDAIDSIATAETYMMAAISTLEEGEDSYSPRSRSGSKEKPVVGSIVRLTEKGRAKYEDLLEEGELVNLEVLRIKGAMLIVRAESEEKFKIPRNCVCIQEDE